MAGYCDISVDLNLRDFALVTKSAVQEVAQVMEERGRADIAGGGFRRQARQSYSTVTSIGKGGYEIGFFARPGWVVGFEYGAVSVGRPLLWMPVPGAPYQGRARGYPGKLYRPKGRRILVNTLTRKIAFIGVPRVTIAARLHLRDIAEEMSKRFLEWMETGGDA